MPQKWFICKDGDKIEIQDCLKSGGCRLKDRCMTKAELIRIGCNRDWNGTPSITQLMNGTCQAYLEITEDYAVHPVDDGTWRLLGSNVHAGLDIDVEDTIKEVGLVSRKYGFKGIPDEYTDEDDVKIITDYKCAGSYKVAKAVGMSWTGYKWDENVVYKRQTVLQDPNGQKLVKHAGEKKLIKKYEEIESKRDCDDYIYQLNGYRILFEEYGFKVDKMRVETIVRDGGTISALNNGITKKTHMIWIPKIDDNIIIDYFVKKKDALLNALTTKKLPDKCNEKETWEGRKCAKFCPVRSICPYNKKG